MFINVGGIFAPFVAVAIRNWWLKANGLAYNADLPALCHDYLQHGESMKPQALENLKELATRVPLDGQSFASTKDFAQSYLSVFSEGFHYAFAAAIVMIFVSLVIFFVNKSRFPNPGQKAVASTDGAKLSREEIKMSAQEVRQRVTALFAVFAVVIFFWMSFHQNGFSLSYFARDYVDLSTIRIDLGFTVIQGAEIFQAVNPIFVVLMTPVVMAIFGVLGRKGKEPLRTCRRPPRKACA